jgi:6-phosphogluconolactonase
MIIQTYPDLESLSRAAAELFARQAEDAIKIRGRFAVALSGGQTPRRTYEILAQPPFREQVDWSRTHVFWGDERCVPGDDPRSNSRLAREALLEQVPLPRAQMHPLSCIPSPAAGARAYETLLRDFCTGTSPGLDLVFLGLGEDGHTASLFPYHQALEEKERWTAAVYVPAPGLNRVTLTPAFINQAAYVAFLVAGAAKAGTLREVMQRPEDPRRLPAQLIKPEPGALYWLADRAAASLIEGRGLKA